MGGCCRARVGCAPADRLRGILGFCGEWLDAEHESSRDEYRLWCDHDAG
jgi:hypothetical protein